MEGFSNWPTQVHISEAKFRVFHTMDRMLYMILVTELFCDPMDAMNTMSFWLWLERGGFLGIIRRIVHLPIQLISELVDEADICLNFINNPQLHLINEVNDINFTQSFIHGFSLQYLQNNQTLAISGVEIVRTQICMQAFSDLMQQTVFHNEARRIAESQQQLSMQLMLSNGSSSSVLPHENRTMFATFSKGYPVTEWEIREFLVQNFGDCIESFSMEEVRKIGDQPLFARIVFFEVDIIYTILNGLPKAKFTINGKHVWMRKYVPRSQKTSNKTTPHRAQ